MEIKINDLQAQIIKGLTHRGLSEADSTTISTHILTAELMGKRTHGIPKLFMMEDAIKARQGQPTIVKDKGNYALVDAHKELGLLSAQFSVDILIDKVKKFDNAVVATINSFYYTMAGIHAKQIADAGFIGIILNNGGPAAITPFGGVDALFGTNPIAIGIPYKHGSIVLDMTTGEQPWGEINLAKVENRTLKPNTFLDADGKFTTDPHKVDAILPFGGYKGAGLNFMFEILTGAFVSAKMGLQSKNGYDLGFLFMAYSPDMFTSKEVFDTNVDTLIKEIKASRKADGVAEIYLPGEKSEREYQKNLATGTLDINADIAENLASFALGEDISTKRKLKQ